MTLSSSPSNSLRLEARDRLRPSASSPRRAMVGLDGFIDEIIHGVDQRFDFATYSRLATMSDYAERIARAAGKSCNVEWVVKEVKLGGNGPIMAGAMGELGSRLTYIGAVGWPEVDPIFQGLLRYGTIIPLAGPGHTDAVEFDDGKIMHGKIETMKDIRWARFVECVGGENEVRRRLVELDLVALTNWTMVPFSSEIYENLFAHSVSEAVATPPMFFVDLADPEKRTREDLAGVCALLGRYAKAGLHIMLGLNHKEALQVAEVLQLTCPTDDTPKSICTLAAGIQRATDITEVVVHPRHRASAATAEGTWCVEGPFTPKPKLSTGAGDHFNAGYCHGRLHGLNPELALIVGKATSGFYVRTGQSPCAMDLDEFLAQWADDKTPE